MIWEIPQLSQDLVLERALGAQILEKANQGALPTASLRKIAKALASLSGTFTAEREKIGKRYLDQEETRCAYLLYFLQSNLPKVWYVLRELTLNPAGEFDSEELRVLDLGSGSGTAGLAVSWFVSQFCGGTKRLQITAIDNSAPALSDYRWLIQRLNIPIQESGRQLDIELTTIAGEMEKLQLPADAKYDLIFLSNSLNELYHASSDSIEKRAQYLNKIIKNHLAESGACAIIEPALQSVSRSFHQVRDRLVDSGWHVYSPCVSDRHCPMLSRDRDWCHQTIDWRRPAVVKQLDELIGNRKERLKFSYVVFRKEEMRTIDCSEVPGKLYRAVGDLQSEKGKDMIYLCGSE